VRLVVSVLSRESHADRPFSLHQEAPMLALDDAGLVAAAREIRAWGLLSDDGCWRFGNDHFQELLAKADPRVAAALREQRAASAVSPAIPTSGAKRSERVPWASWNARRKIRGSWIRRNPRVEDSQALP
jgi:hypothetical protein